MSFASWLRGLRRQLRKGGSKKRKQKARDFRPHCEELEVRLTPSRNVVIFVADGLRAGSVNPTDAPTMYDIITGGGSLNGVNFANSHSVFPTFTTPNARHRDRPLRRHRRFQQHHLHRLSVQHRQLCRQNPAPSPFIEGDQTLGDVSTSPATSSTGEPARVRSPARLTPPPSASSAPPRFRTSRRRTRAAAPSRLQPPSSSTNLS